MPIPTLTDQPPTPRRLLRDVVYDKVFEAIIDGTLELGERLNDDQLVAWLGVSRTPVREAIAKLADQALVDIEANRYTRIVAPSYDEFVDTVRTGYQIWSLVVERGVSALSGAERDEAVAVLDRRLAALAAHEQEPVADIGRLDDLLVEAAGSGTLRRVWATTGPLLQLLFRRAAVAGAFPYDESTTFTTALRDALREGDGERAGELVREQPGRFDGFFAEVRETGIYPA
ncbi:GntR family transcriptional regulator [Frigoribacterium faeni]|uniref:GntR family transcriptional regulator n=1 Tax=Frigoribacterium faeni TaxID=145483 RepID=UPI00141B40A5|nr:GntR family transcriptional regulator [Frigoribacterium faeni]NIJ05555.1 DNA-binding GntR family transcriptional regulator [Frigoribacterium faeni]